MSTIWSKIRGYLPFGGKRFMGKDLEGNKYYEYVNPTGGRMRRVIKYKYMSKMNDYTTGKHRLPIQWTAWLSHTRAKPPTLSELQADHSRQSSLLDKISTIEAREREERIRQGYATIDAPEELHSGARFGLPGRIRAPPSFVPKAPSGLLPPGEAADEGGVTGHSVNSYDNLARATKQQEERSDTSAKTTHPSSEHLPSHAEQSEPYRYQVPTPTSTDIPPPPETVDPARHASKEDLRKLAEEDTKRRIAEQGGEVHTKDTGVEGVATGMGGLKPRRRGQAA